MISRLSALRLVAARKYNRHPAGSPKGGQFASKDSVDLAQELRPARVESFSPVMDKYGLTSNEAAALYFYSTAEYAGINQAVRAGRLRGRDQAVFDGVTRAIEKLPKTTGTVYRGTGVDFSPHDAFKEGQEVQLPGFTSSTSDWRRAQWFTDNSDGAYPLYLEIHAKGRNGADLSHASGVVQRSTERETLFPHNTAFRVLSPPSLVESGGKSWYYVELEEV